MKKYELENDVKDIKALFPTVLEELYAQDEDVVYLDCDLMNSFGTGGFDKKYPGKAINMGIQEANAIGVAAGMSAEGKKPYVHTFGPFASRRVFDQVFLSVGYAKNSVRIIGSDPGVTAAYNGGTHMPFEDIALYRCIPTATIFDIVDSNQFAAVIKLVKDNQGVSYIRTPRKSTINVYDENEKFEIGKGKTLVEGSDVTVVASGIMVAKAIEASQKLREKGISVRVIDPVTVKPLDKELIIAAAKETGAMVTAENANCNGGLSDAVASVLVTNAPVPMEVVAVMDEYGEVGTRDYLEKRFNLTTDAIIEKIEKVIKRKI